MSIPYRLIGCLAACLVLAGPARAGDPETLALERAGLVEVTGLDPAIRIEMRYATPDNFTGRAIYPSGRCFLARETARRLARVQARLAREGLGLKLYDCYRPFSAQKTLWELAPDKRFVARPEKRDGRPARGSRHNRGAAVDLTLVDRRAGNCPCPRPSTTSRPGGPESPGRGPDGPGQQPTPGGGHGRRGLHAPGLGVVAFRRPGLAVLPPPGSAPAAGALIIRRPPPWTRGLGQGEKDHEHAAPSGDAVHGDRPPAGLDDAVHRASPMPVPWPGGLVVKNGSKMRSNVDRPCRGRCRARTGRHTGRGADPEPACPGRPIPPPAPPSPAGKGFPPTRRPRSPPPRAPRSASRRRDSWRGPRSRTGS